MKSKKADIWISAALYFGLGIIVITIILSAGLPLINRLKDKNTVIETKDVMFKLDTAIREVIRNGPGEQRSLSLEIKKGDLSINNNENTLNWSYKTSALLSEPGLTISEGNLNITTENTGVKDEYLVTLSLNYEGLADLKKSSTPDPTEDLIKVSGQNRIIIKNVGTVNSKIAVTLSDNKVHTCSSQEIKATYTAP